MLARFCEDILFIREANDTQAFISIAFGRVQAIYILKHELLAIGVYCFGEWPQRWDALRAVACILVDIDALEVLALNNNLYSDRVILS